MKRTTEQDTQRSVSNTDFAIDCLCDVQQVTALVPHVENEELGQGDLQHLVDYDSTNNNVLQFSSVTFKLTQQQLAFFERTFMQKHHVLGCFGCEV